MIVEVTMGRRGDPFPNPTAQPDYDLCLIEAVAEGLEMTWRFLGGVWRKVSMRKHLPVESVTLNLGGGNIMHVSNPTQFSINIGTPTSTASGTTTWTTP